MVFDSDTPSIIPEPLQFVTPIRETKALPFVGDDRPIERWPPYVQLTAVQKMPVDGL